jgi:hypothetical protein
MGVAKQDKRQQVRRRSDHDSEFANGTGGYNDGGRAEQSRADRSGEEKRIE